MITVLKLIAWAIAGTILITFAAWILLVFYHLLKTYYDVYKANAKR